jgi:hypothetical protein
MARRKRPAIDPGQWSEDDWLEWGPQTSGWLARQVAMRAAICQPGEAWPVFKFETRKGAEQWGNRLGSFQLVPDGTRLEVRGTSLFVIRPAQP